MSSAAVCEGLTKYFGPVRAVERLSFTVERGEVVGFLGPNGAGKSTIAAAFVAVLMVSNRTFGLHVGSANLLAATASAFVLAALFGAIALLAGSATGHRALAAGVASAAAIAGYLLSSLAALVEGLQRFRPMSPFWWYSGHDPLRHGLEPLHIALLVGSTLVCLAAAVGTFERTDLA